MEASQQLPPNEAGPGETQKEFEDRTAPPQVAALAGPLDAQAQPVPVGSLATSAPAPVDAPVDITHHEPILAQGALGADVERLVRLLAAAGYASNSVVNGTNAHAILDESVMADVRRFWNDHPEAREPDELYAGREAGIHELQGQWVGPHTWQALYNFTGAKAS